MRELRYSVLLAVIAGSFVIAASALTATLIVEGFPPYVVLPVFALVIVAVAIAIAEIMIKLVITWSREQDERENP